MFTKFKVFLLTGCFLLIATTALAAPFWQFHAGDLVKYNVSDSSGASWVGTMETIGTVTACGKEYWHLKETNMNNDSAVNDLYIRAEEDAAYQCNGDGSETKFLQTGGIGMTWDTLVNGGGTLHYEIVARLMHGTLYATRSYGGSAAYPTGYKFYVKGMCGSILRVNNMTPNPPTIAVRQGYSGDTLYANFTGQGLYSYDYDGTTTWTRISSTPANMVAAGPILYATWTGDGLYKWDGTTWTRIASVPTDMIASGSNLYATWTGQGLYSWNGTIWTRIASVPANMVVSGNSLYATWTGQGLYKWDGTSWTRISSVPADMVDGQ